jgi:hypothetical protein
LEAEKEQQQSDQLEPAGKQEELLVVSSEEGQKLENLLEQIDRPEETVEKETEDQQEQEQSDLPEQGGQTEVKPEKDAEEQQELEKENLPVLEEPPRELLSIAR